MRKNFTILLSVTFIILAASCAHKGVPFNKANTPLFTFGAIADVQYADIPSSGKRLYRESLPGLENAVEQLKGKNLAFLVHLGDFIEQDFAGFQKLLSVFNRFDFETYHVLGNHDFTVEEKYKNMVPQALGLTSRHYTFSKESWKFIVLDGQDLSIFAHADTTAKHQLAVYILDSLKKEGRINAHSWNGGISDQQMEWLRKELKDAERENQRVMIFCHYPVFPEGNSHNLWNDSEVKAVLQQFDCVKMYVNGHNHAGNDGIEGGIYYLTLKGMVENPDPATFAIFHVYKDYIIVEGFGNEANRIIPLVDVKKLL